MKMASSFQKSAKCVLLLLAITFLSAAASFQNQPVTFASYSSTFVALPPMNLTLVAANGTQVLLNSTEIGGLPSYEARGGYKNILNITKGLANYTGVPFATLCDLVGGIGSNDLLRISSSDGYNISFTCEEVNGAFVTYDPATGDQVEHLQPLAPIIAYHKDDANLSDGPLRVAIVGPEGFATNSTYWAKYVTKLEIIPNAVPELSPTLLVPLVMVSTVFVLAVCKKLGKSAMRKQRSGLYSSTYLQQR